MAHVPARAHRTAGADREADRAGHASGPSDDDFHDPRYQAAQYAARKYLEAERDKLQLELFGTTTRPAPADRIEPLVPEVPSHFWVVFIGGVIALVALAIVVIRLQL